MAVKELILKQYNPRIHTEHRYKKCNKYEKKKNEEMAIHQKLHL